MTGPADGIDIAAFRRGREHTPLRPVEAASGTRRGAAPRGVRADSIMKSGWDRAGADPLSLRPPVAWEDGAASNRSWAYELQAWTPLTPLLTRFEDSGDRAYLDFALAVMLDWIARYPARTVESEFAWYDVAIGARAQRLGFALDAVAREPGYDDATVARLLDAALMHAELLRDDDIVAWHSNHGLLVVAAQLSLATRFPELPGLEADAGQAHERLAELLRRQFTDEGVHREHSPDYHASVLDTIIGLLDDGIVTAPEVSARRREIEDALAWFVLPTGRVATFGDSDWRLLRPRETGAAPDARVRGFPDSGYLVMRTWPESGRPEDASYLAQIAAFHSRTHKHADDLSVIWQERGIDLLVDPGRFGYLGRTEEGSELAREGFWYSHPARVYVESTRAHNTVEIDRRSNPRAGVEPYGSAVVNWGERGEICFGLSRFSPRPELEHSRTLVFHPAEWLLIVDDVVDAGDQAHELTQWFHFGTDVDLTADGAVLTGRLPQPGLHLFCVPVGPQELVEPVRGQEEPELLGWVAPREGVLEPTWTAGYRVASAPRARFATLLALGAEPPAVVAAEPGGAGDPLRLTWKGDGAEHSVHVRFTECSLDVS